MRLHDAIEHLTSCRRKTAGCCRRPIIRSSCSGTEPVHRDPARRCGQSAGAYRRHARAHTGRALRVRATSGAALPVRRVVLWCVRAPQLRHRDDSPNINDRNRNGLFSRHNAMRSTRDIWNGVNSKVARRVPRAIWPVIRRKLDQLDAITQLEDQRVPRVSR